MAHNITTNSDRRPGDSLLEGKVGAALPIEGDSVLVVKGDARGLAGQATFLFHQGYSIHAPSVVLHPWNTDDQRALAITGEDLYAFRELLNELPEEAFVRPKDPVEEFFTIKDVDGDWWVWDSKRGVWAVATIGRSVFNFEASEGVSTEGPDNWAGLKVSDDQESRWTDGDIVKPRIDSTVTYIRRDGKWDRTCMGVIRPGDSSDKLISERVDERGYLVVLQQSA